MFISFFDKLKNDETLDKVFTLFLGFLKTLNSFKRRLAIDSVFYFETIDVLSYTLFATN